MYLKPPGNLKRPTQLLSAERKRKMAQGMLRDDQDHLERQVGCINGFFHLFDKNHTFAGKKIYSTRRLPSSSSSSSSPATTSPSQSERSQLSPTSSSKYSPTTPPMRSSTTLPLSLFENKDGAKTSWKLREAPRLSLDSRLLETKRKLFSPEIRTTPVSAGDDQDKQIGSPSVIARLMGLDPMTKSESGGTDGARCGVPRLRRSASESRATKEFLQYPFLHLEKGSQEIKSDPTKFNPVSTIPAPCSQMRDYSGVQKKKLSSLNPQEFFPEPTMKFGNEVYHDGGDATENLYVEIEKSLQAPSIGKDLDTLKQILEAIHLKGLLHSDPYPIDQRRNQTFNQHRQKHRAPIVLMKPASPSRVVESPPPRRNGKDRKSAQKVSDRRGRASSIGSMSPNSPAKVKKASNQIFPPQQLSPRSGSSPRRSTPPPPSDRVNRPPRIKKTSTKQYSYDEPMKIEEVYHEGSNMLERCDKLLHSISEMSLASQQPSPVSVLDSGGIRDEYDFVSPCANMKRWIQFDDETEENIEEEEEEEVSCVSSPAPAVFTETEGLSQFVHDVLRSDLIGRGDGGICEWLNRSVELSGIIIDIEKLIFKDLITETIKSIPLVPSMVRKRRPAASQRKLLF